MISVTYIVKGFSAFKAFRSNQYNKQQIPTPPKITRKRSPTLLKQILALQTISLAALTTFTDAKAE
jgi:hypothetical protein